MSLDLEKYQAILLGYDNSRQVYGTLCAGYGKSSCAGNPAPAADDILKAVLLGYDNSRPVYGIAECCEIADATTYQAVLLGYDNSRPVYGVACCGAGSSSSSAQPSSASSASSASSSSSLSSSSSGQAASSSSSALSSSSMSSDACCGPTPATFYFTATHPDCVDPIIGEFFLVAPGTWIGFVQGEPGDPCGSMYVHFCCVPSGGGFDCNDYRIWYTPGGVNDCYNFGHSPRVSCSCDPFSIVDTTDLSGWTVEITA